MVETVEPRHRNHPAAWARNSDDLASCRSLLLQREVCPVIVIVKQVVSHQPLEMPLVEHDHMIEQVSPAIAHEAFCNSVLPRAAEAGPLGLDPEALDGADHFSVEVGCASPIFRPPLVSAVSIPQIGWRYHATPNR
jgi:hypothetical protein